MILIRRDVRQLLLWHIIKQKLRTQSNCCCCSWPHWASALRSDSGGFSERSVYKPQAAVNMEEEIRLKLSTTQPSMLWRRMWWRLYFWKSWRWVWLNCAVISWAVLHNFSVAMVTHHNRRKKWPEFPAEVLPAAQHPIQPRNMFPKSVFHRKKLGRKRTHTPHCAVAGVAGSAQNLKSDWMNIISINRNPHKEEKVKVKSHNTNTVI